MSQPSYSEEDWNSN